MLQKILEEFYCGLSIIKTFHLFRFHSNILKISRLPDSQSIEVLSKNCNFMSKLFMYSMQ